MTDNSETIDSEVTKKVLRAMKKMSREKGRPVDFDEFMEEAVQDILAEMDPQFALGERGHLQTKGLSGNKMLCFTFENDEDRAEFERHLKR